MRWHMENRKDVTVPMPQELVDAIDKQLEYGDSRSAWIREAARERLERDAEGEDADEGNIPSAMAD